MFGFSVTAREHHLDRRFALHVRSPDGNLVNTGSAVIPRSEDSSPVASSTVSWPASAAGTFAQREAHLVADKTVGLRSREIRTFDHFDGSVGEGFGLDRGDVFRSRSTYRRLRKSAEPKLFVTVDRALGSVKGQFVAGIDRNDSVAGSIRILSVVSNASAGVNV